MTFVPQTIDIHSPLECTNITVPHSMVWLRKKGKVVKTADSLGAV